jgi:hypothetical protein
MSVPDQLRAPLRAELDALTRGERPSLLTWVKAYGASGAVLVAQPEDIWTHPDSQVERRQDGTGWGVVPLWTAEESPSDLSAEFEIDADGRVEIRDVRVL